MKLDKLVNVPSFESLLANGYISERIHPRDPELRIYTYTRKALYAGLWTPETRAARGLILRVNGPYMDAEIVARGIPKFFTVDQSNSDWGRGKIALFDDDEGVRVGNDINIEEDSPAIVSDKLDGSLGVLYFTDDGPALATKGSFDSDVAIVGTEILNRKYRDILMDPMIVGHPGTLCFEIISPKFEHVVDYGDTEDIFPLGFISDKGVWTPISKTDAAWYLESSGMTIPKTYPAHTLREALELPYDINHEGVVITVRNQDGSQTLFKVKYDEFFELRKLRYAETDKQFMSGVVSDMTREEILSARGAEDVRKAVERKFPEANKELASRFIGRRAERIYDIVSGIQDRHREVMEALETLSALDHSSRRAFALDLSSRDFPFRSAAFKVFDGMSVSDAAFAEVISSWDKNIQVKENGQVPPEKVDHGLLIILRGLPCSGKSTYAREYVENHGRAVHVSRDVIRASLFDDYVPRQENEPLITSCEHSMIRAALRRGYTVLSDAQNLDSRSLKKLKEIGTEYGDVIIHDIDTPVDECLRRAHHREEVNPRNYEYPIEAVILAQALRFGKIKKREMLKLAQEYGVEELLLR